MHLQIYIGKTKNKSKKKKRNIFFIPLYIFYHLFSFFGDYRGLISKRSISYAFKCIS